MRATILALALFATATSGWAELPSEALRRKEAGNQQLKQRKYEAARDQYLAALKLAPEYADVHYNLGVLYFFRLGDDRRALYHFVRYARLKPNASDLGQVRSLTTQALEKIEGAEREAYAEALRIGTPGAIEAFRRAHPQSPYSKDAEQKLRLLAEYDKEVRRRTQATREAFDRAVTRATPEAMDEFLKSHPGAPQSAEATRLRDQWAEQRAQDEKAFLAAVDVGTSAAMAAFLEERPDSPYAAEAQKQIQKLGDAEDAYRIASEARSVPALEQFLVNHGDAPQATEARALLDSLQTELGEAEAATAAAVAARAAADQDWRSATAAESVSAYREFLEKHPGHARAPQARDRIAALEQQAAAAQLRAEADQVWQAVEGENLAPAYRDFAIAYPDHPNAAEAGRRASTLEAAAAAAAVEAQADAAAEKARAAANRAWESAARKDTATAYQAFLTQHPDHPEAGTARERIAALQREAEEAQLQAARLQADRAWKEADRAETVVAYETFLAAYPDHPKADQARREIERLHAEADEAAARAARQEADQAWEEARRTDTVVSYEAFLAAHSAHPRADQAREEIERLHAEAAEATALAARQEADLAWKSARRDDTIAAYQAFLADYPGHPKAESARSEIRDLQREAAEEKANEAWRIASEADTVPAYQEFLAAYPDHGKAGKAERSIRKLEKQAADEAWKRADRSDTIGAYQTFLATYPEHGKADKARDRIEDLEEEAATAAAEEASRATAARAWSAAEGQDTAGGYQAFYQAWPDHPQAGEARRRAAAMAAAAAQTPVAEPPTPEQPAVIAATEAWSEARDTDTVAAYESFLRQHPEAEEAAAAHSRLSELKEASQQSSPDGQLSRSRRKALDRYRRMLVDE